MLLRDAIGQVVRRLRREREKTLQQLSDAARVSLPYISEIERGRKEVSSEILQTLCLALEVPLDSFLLEVSSVLAEDAPALSRTATDAAPASIIELASVRNERNTRSTRTPARSGDVQLAA